MPYILLCIAKMLCCSGILLGYYWFFLRNQRFHQYNRYYLIITILVSIVVPFLQSSINFFGNDEMARSVYEKFYVSYYGDAEEITVSQQGSGINWTQIVWIIYSAGLIIGGFVIIRSLMYINKLKRTHIAQKIGSVNLFMTSAIGTPFSFLQNIFWHRSIPLDSKEGKKIFQHELFHIKQYHTIDSLFSHVVTTCCWFNPFFYIIRNELRTIHEYLADQYAAGDDGYLEYAELLLERSLLTHRISISHHFFQHQLKRRINMLVNFQFKKAGYVSRLLALPIVLFISILLLGFAAGKQEVSTNSFFSPGENFQIQDSTMKNELTKYYQRNLRSPKMSSSGSSKATVAATVSLKKDGSFESIQFHTDPSSLQSGYSSITVVSYQKGTGFDHSAAKAEVERVARSYRFSSQPPGYYEILIEFVNEPALTGVKDDEIKKTFVKAEVMPKFPGGDEAWRTFLNKHLRYPQLAIDEEVMGTAIITFVVQTDGSLRDIQISKDPGHGLGDEAKRIIDISGNWIPAMQNGKKVDCYFKQPITFRLERQ